MRLFGLAGTIDRFIAKRTGLHDLQYAPYVATCLREHSVIWSMLLVVSASVLVFWLLASPAADSRISLGEVVVYVQSSVGVSMITFGGFSWALDGAGTRVTAVLRLAGILHRQHQKPRQLVPLRLQSSSVTAETSIS